MSEHELMRRRQGEEEQDERMKLPTIGVYESEIVDEIKVQNKLKDIYIPIQYPMCSNYEPPNLAPIKERKLELGKKFAEQAMKKDNIQNEGYDGLYGYIKREESNSNNMIRQKIRIVRDVREQFYEENGQLILEKDFFSEDLSKLANISFQNNDCLLTYQKNAILSERNNQKKQRPFTMELCIGGIWFNQHPLNNQEERTFQEIRVLLKEWAYVSLHPSLPEIVRELQFLERIRDGHQEAAQIDRKIELLNKKYSDEKLYLETLMKQIINKNNELKDVRKKTGMESVPWKINLKQFEVDGKPSYDIGVTPFEVSQKIVAISQNQVEEQQKRRQYIREEVYFVKVYANNEFVGKSQKFKLQWPSFRVPLLQKFTILVYTAPATLKVEILKSGFINQIIDTIYLAVPGNNANSLTSSEKRYAATTFSLNGKDFRKKLREEKKDDLKPHSDTPSGILLHRIQWKGEGNKMPILAPKTAEEETACTEETQFDEESVLQELFDAKDPRIPHRALKERVESDIKKAGNALLPFVDVQSSRHLLLKMKTMMPELEHIQIPLLEEEVRNRQDLMEIIDNEQEKRFRAFDTAALQYYNPLEGIFEDQPQIVIRQIKEVIGKIKILKALSSGSGAGTIRFKIIEQIINEFIFEQEESPLAVFFKNLFTQKRKLGPQPSKRNDSKAKLDELEINMHIRSARNMPIRQTSFERIKNFQDEENKFKQQQMMNLANVMYDRFGGYGQGFYRQQPNINMHGNTFFTAFQNQGQRNNQVNYSNQHLQLDRANTFMELRFKKTIRRTRCFEGPYPQWNQTLFFNYSTKHEQTNFEKILMNGETSLKLYVFDMIEQSKPTQALAEARVKKTKFYLGRIDVPFSFLLTVPSVSGMFKVDRPLVQLGYGIRKSGLFEENDLEEMAKTQNPQTHTYVNLDLFSEPLVDSTVAYNSDRKFIQGGENPLVLQRASQWIEDLNTKRYVRLWLNNLEGKSVFICRYLSDAISPPRLAGQGGIGSQIERAARFVSLIPRKQNCKLLEGTEQFHMKCDQFLNVKMGEDHGILLCNYFNYIDRAEGRRDYQSFLLVCKAFPYGKCFFVLRRDANTKNSEVWDPYKGECYYFPAKEYDTFCCFIKYEKQIEAIDRNKDPCPVLQVSCIVSRDNVYYNNQNYIKPPSIDFDIEDDKLWKPFLNQRSRGDMFERGNIESIQTPVPTQFYPELQKLQSTLQTQIQKYLKEHLEKQRISHFRPYSFRINPRISNSINNHLLSLCEQFKADHRILGAESTLYNDRTKTVYEQVVAKIQEQRDRVKTDIPPEKTLYGFTLNMTYTTLSEILEKVTETQIHLDENQDIEFVLSVRCYEYPCHLVSVWIFIGTIV